MRRPCAPFRSFNPRRRFLAASGAVLAAGAMGGAAEARAADFVRIQGTGFVRRGRPYRYVGANLWYGAYLAAAGPTGDLARLRRELDRLKALGISNLRVLAASELSPLKNSLEPAFQSRSGALNSDLLAGLDRLLVEMRARDMTAVLYLSNFWEWSGGMMTYQAWLTGQYIDMGDPAHPWPEFPDRSAQFYKSPDAIGLYHAYVRRIVGRTNAFSGVVYQDDPTIMAWQLCNEPRPVGTEARFGEMRSAYLDWIGKTAALIRGLDAHHLVSLGHEGVMGCAGSMDCVRDAHRSIDYLTAHIWPQNWSWFDLKDPEGGLAGVKDKTRAYIAAHLDLAERMDKPLVIEEFGFPRDGLKFDPEAGVTLRDQFYRVIYEAVADSAARRGALAGSNFWAWGGEGRAQHPDHRMLRGETGYLGDPPHEPQGWYSVFDTDQTTQALIRDHAAALARSPA